MYTLPFGCYTDSGTIKKHPFNLYGCFTSLVQRREDWTTLYFHMVFNHRQDRSSPPSLIFSVLPVGISALFSFTYPLLSCVLPLLLYPPALSFLHLSSYTFVGTPPKPFFIYSYFLLTFCFLPPSFFRVVDHSWGKKKDCHKTAIPFLIVSGSIIFRLVDCFVDWLWLFVQPLLFVCEVLLLFFVLQPWPLCFQQCAVVLLHFEV